MTAEPEDKAEVEPAPDQQPLPGWELTVEASRSGPLPPVREFAGYESVLPGAAERIFQMAETEMKRRHEADKAADERDKAIVEAQVKLALRAQWITVLIVLAFIGLFALAVWRGQQLAGVAAGIAALATIIYALNGGRFWRRGSDTEISSTDVDRRNG